MYMSCAEFVKIHRGGKPLYYEGYIYTNIQESLQGNTFWRCKKYKSSCSGRATSEVSNIVVRQEHNHPTDLATTKKDQVVSQMKKRAKEETVSIHRINDEGRTIYYIFKAL